MSWNFPQFNLPMFGNNNPMFDSTFSTTQRRGPMGNFATMSYSNSLNTFGKATILGQLGSGIASIFFNKSNLNPIQKFNIGVNSGVYGLLNNNMGFGGNPMLQGSQQQQDIANLKGIYSKYTILNNGNGTYSLTKGDGKVYKTGTFAELKEAAENAGKESQGVDSEDTKTEDTQQKQDEKADAAEGNGKSDKPSGASDSSQTAAAADKKYVVAYGETIETIARKVLEKQGKTNPTRAEINDAKAQIIKDNPNAVKTKNGQSYFLVGAEIKVSQDIGTNNAQEEIAKYKTEH